MAERSERSPTKASKHAFWTNVENALFLYGSEKNTADENPKVIIEVEKQNVQQKGDRFAISDGNLHAHHRYIGTGFIANVDKQHGSDVNDEDEDIRRNVWSDIDDEVYIASLIQSRTNNEHDIKKRDTSAYISDSDISAKVVSSVKLEYGDMWEIEPTDLTECDCLGPPPEFLLPPPPRPPFLQADYYCGDDPIADLETCDTEPVSI